MTADTGSIMHVAQLPIRKDSRIKVDDKECYRNSNIQWQGIRPREDFECGEVGTFLNDHREVRLTG